MDSHSHLFFTCDFSRTVWRQVKKEVELYGFHEDWDTILHALRSDRGPRLLAQKLALEATVYTLWNERNRRLFQDTKRTMIQIAKDVRDVILLRLAWKHRRTITFWN